MQTTPEQTMFKTTRRMDSEKAQTWNLSPEDTRSFLGVELPSDPELQQQTSIKLAARQLPGAKTTPRNDKDAPWGVRSPHQAASSHFESLQSSHFNSAAFVNEKLLHQMYGVDQSYHFASI